MPARRTLLLAAGALALGTLGLAACSSGDPLAADTPRSSGSASGGSIVVGSAAFPENEILAYVYAGALNANGIQASVKPNIGARDVYLAALTDGSIDLVPEYTGNLLQYYDAGTTALSSEQVYAELQSALPAGFQVLEQAQAQDADSYNVTEQFSQQYGVTSLADLKKVPIPLSVAANPEFATRPYGIPGLKEVYGVDATLVPVSDSGGPNTLKALLDGQVQLADIYSTTPSIAQNKLVTLEDPEHLILAQNVVPLISSAKASDKVAQVLNTVQRALTTEDLIAMNTKSSGDAKESAQQIASEWLSQKKLFG